MTANKRSTFRVKIISNGMAAPDGTKIIDVETGRELRHISSLRVEFPGHARFAPMAHIEMHFTPIDLEVEGLVEGTCPFCENRFQVDEIFKRDNNDIHSNS